MTWRAEATSLPHCGERCAGLASATGDTMGVGLRAGRAHTSRHKHTSSEANTNEFSGLISPLAPPSPRRSRSLRRFSSTSGESSEGDISVKQGKKLRQRRSFRRKNFGEVVRFVFDFDLIERHKYGGNWVLHPFLSSGHQKELKK